MKQKLIVITPSSRDFVLICRLARNHVAFGGKEYEVYQESCLENVMCRSGLSPTDGVLASNWETAFSIGREPFKEAYKLLELYLDQHGVPHMGFHTESSGVCGHCLDEALSWLGWKMFPHMHDHE